MRQIEIVGESFPAKAPEHILDGIHVTAGQTVDLGMVDVNMFYKKPVSGAEDNPARPALRTKRVPDSLHRQSAATARLAAVHRRR
jgi:hypothetical protein